MNSLDLAIRSQVKKWLRLPMNTPDSYFYSCWQDGGIGLKCLWYVVPAMKLSRFRKATWSEDPILKAIAASDWFQAEMRSCESGQMMKGMSMERRTERDQAWSYELHKTSIQAQISSQPWKRDQDLRLLWPRDGGASRSHFAGLSLNSWAANQAA